LSTRSRAVTAADFEWIALQTPKVRVRRAIVVPRRRPLPTKADGRPLQLCPPPKHVRPKPGGDDDCGPPIGVLARAPGQAAITSAPLAIRYSATSVADCGPPLPDPPTGLDDDFEAPGVVSVVVVPDGPQPPSAVRPSLVELVPT